MQQQTLKKKNLYTNGKMLAPDGELLCRIGTDKINWYLEKGLAKLVNNDPPTIKLNFEPKGRGKSKDAFYLADRKNECSVCGENGENTLTKHHIVPYCYRKYFPISLKRHVYHDVVLMCQECHWKYEESANVRKKQLHKRYDVPMHRNGEVTDDILLVAKQSADVILSGDYEEKDMDYLKVFFKRNIITQEDLGVASQLNPMVKKLIKFCPGNEIINKVEDVDQFILDWRTHFIDMMNPKFLPEYWDINKNDSMYEKNRRNDDD